MPPTPKTLSRRKDHNIANLVAMIITSVPENPAVPVPIDFAGLMKEYGNKRLYDVLNVMEAVLLVSSPHKQSFFWNGCSHLPQTLALLQKISDQLKMSDVIKKFKENKLRPIIEDHLIEAAIPTSIAGSSSSGTDAVVDANTLAATKVKMSQAVLTQKVLMVFMSEAPNFVSVQMCAEILSIESRRIYDVVNVLAALPVPLLKKSQLLSKNGKILKYSYCGPSINVDALTEADIRSLPFDKRAKNTLFRLGMPKEVVPAKPGVKLTLMDGQVIFLPGNLTISVSTVHVKKEPESNAGL